MADSKITALAALTTADPANDMFPVVDVSDTSMAASGTTKRISINNILACSPSATLASATITGAATVGTTLGVTGVSTFAAGTALLPALTTTGDTNTGIYYPAADTFAVTTGGIERYRVDSAGNLGIGVTPSAWGTGLKVLQVGARGYGSFFDFNNDVVAVTANLFWTGSTYSRISASSKYAVAYYQDIGSGAHQWLSSSAAGTNGVTPTMNTNMTLDASGNLLVGTTSSLPSFANGRIEVLAAASSYCIVADATATSAAAIGVRGNDSTVAASFYNASTGGTVGSIVINSGGVSYNTTSDYRLKESVQPISGGLARVNALKPSIYNWKSNGSTGEGFIAHELAEVVPFAVSGEKDAVNADGTIKSQGIDMSRIVPILVAAIQELTAEVNALKNA